MGARQSDHAPSLTQVDLGNFLGLLFFPATFPTVIVIALL
jgi:hypothetical protein